VLAGGAGVTDGAVFDWRRYAWMLVLAYALVYLLPLGARPVTIPDEARYAEIPREMITTGDWITPRLNGLRYFEKPVLGYWINAISISAFGENAFAMRLPSALAAGLSALAIFLLLRRFGRGPRTALAGAMAYLGMLGVFLIGTINLLDSVFSFLLTAAFTAFYFAHREAHRGRRNFYLVLLGVFCGAAFLSKGFLAFVLLGIVIAPYVIREGRWRELYRRGWLPLLVAGVVVAPWALLVHLAQPEYWHYFFWEEHIKRFASDSAQHSEPFWYYLLFLPLMAMPWTGLLPAVLAGLKAENQPPETRSLVRYAWFWLLLPLLFFSISRGKLPTYILPCLAPLAVLLAIGVESALETGREKLFRLGGWLVLVFYAVMLLLIVLVQSGVTANTVWSGHESWKWLLFCAALAAGIGLVWLAMREQVRWRRVVLFAASIVALMLTTQFALPQRTTDSKMPGAFLLEHVGDVTPDTVLVSDDIMIHAVNWFFHRSDVFMISAGESAHGLSFEDSKHRLIAYGALKQFIDEHTQRHPLVIVFHADSDQRVKPLMPPRATEYRSGLFVLWLIPAADDSGSAR
jgi:4-amino-4-deoxy-L-arabinose transferase